jgi:predicted transcriptional regulator
MEAIFSIHTQFARAIYTGIKKAEMRTVVPKKPVSRIWLYETKPAGKITGCFTVASIHHPRQLDELLNLYSAPELYGRGVHLETLQGLFGDRFWYAIEVKKAYKLENEIDPKALFQKWTSPQSWRYLTEEESQQLQESVVYL